MHRFFVESGQVEGRKGFILGDDAKHLEKVLRLKVGDKIEIVIEEEQEYVAEITGLEGKKVEIRLLGAIDIPRESPLKITLYQGLPKASKMEMIIQKAVELGVYRIVPVITDRSIVQLKTKKDQENKRERWQKIAYEAAKQSKRLKIPIVSLPMEFSQVLKNLTEDIQIVAYEDEKKTRIKDLPFFYTDKEVQILKNSMGLWVGPEGGFTMEEVESIKREKGYSVTLGPRILRTETASISFISMIQYESGDLGG